MNHSIIKSYGRVEVQFHAFLIFALEMMRQLHVPADLRCPGIHCKEGLIVPTDGLGFFEKRKEVLLVTGIEPCFPGNPARIIVTIPPELSQLLALIRM
jgi:hypothetical protein